MMRLVSVGSVRALLDYALKRLLTPESLIQGTVLSVVGAGGNRVFQICALLLAAHRFGHYGLSVISAVILWSSILGLAIAPGFSLPLTGAVAGARARGERSMALILFLIGAAIVTVAVTTFAVWQTAGITAPGLSKTEFAVFLGAMASGFCVQAVSLAGLIAERVYPRAMLSSLALGGSQIIAVFVASDPLTAITCAVGGAVLAGSLSAAMLIWTVWTKNQRATKNFTQWRVMLGRIPPSLIGSSVVEPTNLIVLTYIFGSVQPPIETAVITVAQQWISLLLFIPAIGNQVILPHLMHTAEAGDFAGYRYQARRIIVWNFVLTLAPAAALIVLSPVLLTVYHLVGENYPFIILLCAGWFAALALPLGTVLTGLGHFKLTAFGNVLWCTIFFSAALALAMRSTDGFAEARFIAYGIYLIFSLLATFIRLQRLHDQALRGRDIS